MAECPGTWRLRVALVDERDLPPGETMNDEVQQCDGCGEYQIIANSRFVGTLPNPWPTS